MDTLKQGLLTVDMVTDEQEMEIQQLTDLCNLYENLHLHFSQHRLGNRLDRIMPNFLYYEDEMLVGYLVPDSFGMEEKELLGMVHPDYRRRGIFTALLEAAKEVCKARGVERLVFVVEKASASGQAFVKAVGAEYDFSEHSMVLESFRESNVFDDRLNVQRAYESDLDAVVLIMTESFGNSVEKVQPRAANWMHDPNCQLYIATFGEYGLGCKEPIGCLRLHEADDSIGIYGFGVRPDYRRRGYGRQMLEEVVREVRARSEKPITLDVDVENPNAQALYRSTGFIAQTTYDYYNWDIG